MTLLITKYAVTAFVIVLVSEVAKRSDRLGALISSLPFVTIMVMVWLHLEKQGTEKLASHAFYTFWYVIPTIPMFLLLPWLLHKGTGFWWALLWSALLTFVCFIATMVQVNQDMLRKRSHLIDRSSSKCNLHNFFSLDFR